jgi:transposase, IS30 family
VYWADSIGRRNTSIVRSCDGTSTRLDNGSDGKALDALPGRPTVGRRVDRQRFWAAIAGGLSSEDAAAEASVSPAVGTRWFRECGGMPNIPQVPLSGRYLSFADREEIAILRGLGHGGRQIARKINRSPSTVSRELRRNTATRGGRLKYKATSAQGMRTGGRDARRRPSWPPTTGCTTTCRSGSRAG